MRPAARIGHIPRKHRRPCPSRPGVRRYEDTQAAASKTEQRHKVVMWTCIGVFAFGLWAVQSSSASDKAAKERGELVDAWERAAGGAFLLGARGLYRCPADHLHVFLALMDVEAVEHAEDVDAPS